MQRFLPRSALVLVLGLVSACGAGSGTDSASSDDPVDQIVNAVSRAAHQTFWRVRLASDQDFSFWADGMGAYRGTGASAGTRLFTWVKLGPASVLLQGLSDVPGAPSTLSDIAGGIGEGTFSAELDDNPTRRTFSLQGGTVISPQGPGAGTLYVTFPTQTGIAIASASTLSQIGNISGGNSGFSIPTGIAVHPGRNELVVANSGSDAVVVHATSSRGNVAPLRTIQGPSTGLAFDGTRTFPHSPFAGIDVDAVNDEIFVSNDAATPPSITVFAITAAGDTAPLRTIQGAATTLAGPLDVSVNPTHGEIYVTDHAPTTGPRVLVFSRTADGDVAPLRTLTVGGYVRLHAVDVDPVAGEMWVAGATGGSTSPALRIYARTASGTQPPLTDISGNLDHLAVDVDVASGETAVIHQTFSGNRLFIWDASSRTVIQDTDADGARDVARGP